MRRAHFCRLVSVLGSLSPITVLAFVGVNDNCPVPTPYPPASAGAGVCFNTSMEGGFTGGAANQWTPSKASILPGQVFFAGGDRPYAGSYSQKLDLPQPDGYDADAGLYQQIWVVPGGTYTLTAKVYLHFTEETYGGEDLVARIGLNPFGDADLSGSGMVWSFLIGSKDQWMTASVTTKAALSVMTISLKATRKFPQHGDGALAWFDEVTFSGPIPTGTRPGPEPDPVDPETLIPSTVGPNWVTNPSFEGAYSGQGIAEGWNGWSTVGSGTWRRSQRVGKVGAGQYSCGGADNLAAMRSKTILLIGGDPFTGASGTYGDSAYLASTYPELENTIFIGRPYIDSYQETWKSDPTYWGAWLADQLHTRQLQWPRIDAWQCNNEPDWGDTWQQVVAMEKAFAERLHFWGMKSCSLNLSTGSPGNIWRMVDETYDPACRDLLTVADYLGQHCYGGPANDLMVTNQIEPDYSCSFALRPRKFKDMYDRRGWRFPPVIATEGSTWGPWHGTFSPATIGADLMAMGDYMNANRWWCGYTNFVVGSQCIGGWEGWDIVGQGTIIPDVANWNMDHPADAMDGLYSQMVGAGKVHPRTAQELTPAGLFNGGINQAISGLTPGQTYLLKCWIKYEFRGAQPAQLKFHLGVDGTGQTSDPAAPTIDWGADQIAGKAPVHEIFSHVWRTFSTSGSAASIWLRASQAVADPSFMFYIDQVEVRAVAGDNPLIGLPTGPVQVAAALHADPPDGTFTVCNAGVGTLNYSISDDAGWLSVSPTQGSLASGCDQITIVYDTSALPLGSYPAAITVAAPGALNSPQMLTVLLEVKTAKPDFDVDGDVDQTDFGKFQQCLTGPGIEQSAASCEKALLDDDNDVDPMDVNIFLNCFSGPDLPADIGCTP